MALPANSVRQLIYAIAATTLLYAVFVAVTGVADVWDMVLAFGATGWAIVLSFSLINYGLRYVRWRAYLKRLGDTIPWGEGLRIYLAGFAFTTTPGKAGEAVRSWYLRRYNVTWADSLAAMFVERLVDVIAMIILSFFAVAAMGKAVWPVAVAGVAVVGALPVIHSARIHGIIDRWLKGRASERLRSAGAHILHMLRSSSVLTRSGPLYSGLVVGVISWGVEGVGLYVILDQLGAEISIGAAIGIYAISVLAGAVSLVPGGIGGTEAVMTLLLVFSGVDTPTAVAATLICRVATLWFAVLIGMPLVLDLEVRKPAENPSAGSDTAQVRE